jgi:hypothetical protein
VSAARARRRAAPDAASDILAAISAFDGFARPTARRVEDGLLYLVNEYWTARQRQSHALHEVSYRACFKAELPRFFIERLTAPGDLVHDGFMGRGTTLIEGALLGRRVAGSDVNPLSAMLVRPRLAPPLPEEIARRLTEIDWRAEEGDAADADLRVFYHPDTLGRLQALRRWFAARTAAGLFDAADDWIRLVAMSRLTGHSGGFFSVYTLPPNQAASPAAQRRINARRGQMPPRRDLTSIILRKSRALLKDGAPAPGLCAGLFTASAARTPDITDGAVALVVTSPPFLDMVDYRGDNWLRCWFAGIDPAGVAIDRHRATAGWEGFVRGALIEFSRIVRPGGHVAFEVGEARGGAIPLERHVAAAAAGLPLDLLAVVVNEQMFTKTAQCWGVGNNLKGTNSNRIVLMRRR